MNIPKKLGLAALAMTLSCGPMLAQDGPRDAVGASDGGEMMGPGGPGSVDPGGPAGPRRTMDRGSRDRERGGFERTGRRRGGFGLSRALSDPEIQQKVGVSAEQLAKIRQQESSFRKTSIEQRADLEVKRIDLQDLLSADKPDRTAIEKALERVSASRLAMEKSRIDFRLNMKDALTPEQREKLRQAMRERRQARRGEGRSGPGGPGGRGPRSSPPASPAPGGDGQTAKPGE
jgi:Spy/CpxP family protein refolding chaperone